MLANPVAAGLVRHGAEWPGPWTSPEQIGAATLTARKPKLFFARKSHLANAVDLELTTPPCFASAAEFCAQLTARLQELEARHHHDLAAQGRRLLGIARVLSQHPFSRPPAGEPRFELKPRIAARDKWRRIEGLLRLKSFVHAYRAASAEWRSGVRDVVFPSGTYLLRVLHGVRCAGAA